MLFSNMDFNFAHFAHFNFAYFETEESFGLIWIKLQNGRMDYKFSILVLVSQIMVFNFIHYERKKNF